VSKCPRCGAKAEQGDVICVACGTNLLTGKRVTVSTASSEIRTGAGLTWSDAKPWIVAGSVVVAAAAALILVLVFVLRDYTARGKTLLSEGLYEDATIPLRTAIERDESDFEAHFYMGVAQSFLGNHSEAAYAFERATELNAQSLESHLLLGLTYGVQRNYERELDELEFVLGLNPNHADARFMAGLAYGLSGDREREASYLIQAAQLRPNDASIPYHLGVAYSRQEQYDDAIRAFQNALVIKPNSADTLLALGISYDAGGAVLSALTALQDALSKRTQFAYNAHFHLGLALSATNQWAEARDQFSRAVELRGNGAAARYFQGVAELTLGNLDAASTSFNYVIQLSNPKYSPQARMQLGLLNLRQGDTATAENELRAAAGAQPTTVAANIQLGKVLKQEGRHAAAIRAFRSAIDAAPNNPIPHLALAVFYVEQKNTDYAVREFQKYLELAPSGAESESVRRIVVQLQESAQS
jgi:tetratricopeptide (TPR) repeat protein